MSFDYISQYNEQNLDVNSLNVPSIHTEELDVTHNISVGGTVDGVNVSALNLEVKDHEERINVLEDALDGDYVDLATDQTIYGKKTFENDMQTQTVTIGRSNATVGPYLKINSVNTGPLFESINTLGGYRGSFIRVNDPARLSWFGSAVEFYKGLDVKTGDITMSATGKVDGVDVSLLGARVATLESQDFSHMVTLNTDQTITGQKTFTTATTIKDANATKYGQISTMVAPATGTASMNLLSSGDNGCNIVFGAAMEENLNNARYKWRLRSEGIGGADFLQFSAGPYFTGNNNVWEPMLVMRKLLGTYEVHTAKLLSVSNTVSAHRVDVIDAGGGRGLISSGIGIRNAGNAEQMLISHDNSNSELFFCHDNDGKGIADSNVGWYMSSNPVTKDFRFEAGPKTTGGAFDRIMDFKHDAAGRVINMYKKTTIHNDLHVKHPSSKANVTSSVGVRNAGRAQTFLMTDGDDVSEIWFGSYTGKNVPDSDDANMKYCISSRVANGDGRLAFYRSGYYSKGINSSMMDFTNTPRGNVYDCTLTIRVPSTFISPVNITSNVEVKGDLNASSISTGSLTVNSNKVDVKVAASSVYEFKGPFSSSTNIKVKVAVQLIGNTVTLTVGGIPPTETKTAETKTMIQTNTGFHNILFPTYTPDESQNFIIPIHVGAGLVPRVVQCLIDTTGTISIYPHLVPEGSYDTRVRWASFSHSWVKGVSGNVA